MAEAFLESLHPDVDHKGRNKDGRADDDQGKQHALLKGVQGGQIDRVQSRQGHGTDGYEQRICVSDTSRRRRGAPEYDAGKETRDDEVDVVEGNEIEGWGMASDKAGNSTKGTEGKSSGEEGHGG